MRESLEHFCKRTGNLALLAQWDAERNAPMTADKITHGSKQRVWWRCPEGHTWQAAVHTRTGSGSGCPVCAGKIPQIGKNDLATLYPQLAAQWHPVKNEGITPQQILPGSHQMAWWICEKGHIWQAQVKSRVAGCGCPVCKNRLIVAEQNDLASCFPEIAAQWHPTRNGALLPTAVSSSSRRKVWWLCEKGHEWQALVFSRTRGGSGCPVCAGRVIIPGENDFATVFPGLAAQWHPTKNGALTPSEISPYSNRKVWWQCSLGHEYQAVVTARTTQNSGCPYCAGKKVLPGFNDLATREPEIAAQWHPTLNGILQPEMVTVGTRRKVWWQCNEGHVWKAVVYSRTGSRRCGCPICAGKVKQKRTTRYFSTVSPQLGEVKYPCPESPPR